MWKLPKQHIERRSDHVRFRHDQHRIAALCEPPPQAASCGGVWVGPVKELLEARRTNANGTRSCP
jgi:hypothetical protein